MASKLEQSGDVGSSMPVDRKGFGNAVPKTLIELLQQRASRNPEGLAYTFLASKDESHITYAELEQDARAIASHLGNLAVAGDRVLLVYSSGLAFIRAYFGCLYAGLVAVPVSPPSPNRLTPRLTQVLDNAEVAVILTTPSLFEIVQSHCTQLIREPQLLTLEQIESSSQDWQPIAVDENTIAMLQYTSGSTSTPKGVVLSHGNLMHNVSIISHGFTDTKMKNIVGMLWLPNYHDMGLIGGILAPIYIGCHTVLMAPASFIVNPYRWLEAISRYKATISGAPNFAYELCVSKISPEQRESLDLSSWQVAFCGAEPIHSETLSRFAETFAPCGFRTEAFYPCYGLAEATLLVTGVDKYARPSLITIKKEALGQGLVVETVDNSNASKTLVGCGHPLPGLNVNIVNAETGNICKPSEVGEVWISGPSVAKGYWQSPEETRAAFGAYINGSNQGPFFRTGDLGFFHEQELFVVGRSKDLIIIRGSNYYPYDIERHIGDSLPQQSRVQTAAFSVEDELTGQEQLIILKELDRHAIRKARFNETITTIRQSVAEAFELQVYAVVLVRFRSLPLTSSGKIRRFLCRRQFLDGG